MENFKNPSTASYSQTNLLTGRSIRENIKKRNGKVNIKDLNNIISTNKIANGYISLINKIKTIKEKESTVTDIEKQKKIAYELHIAEIDKNLPKRYSQIKKDAKKHLENYRKFENINNDKDVKNQFKNFIDYLTVALRSRYSGVDVSKDKILFADKSNLFGKYSITREGIKKYLDFIFNDEELKTTDDEIDAILEMCTHRHTSLSSVACYTNTTKEFLNKIGIENINNENLLQIKNLLENPLCNENTFDYFIMVSIIKGDINYSNKKTLFNSFDESIKNLTINEKNILFHNYLVNNDEIYKSKLYKIVNKFNVIEEIKESKSNALLTIESALKNPYQLNEIFKKWSSFDLNYFSDDKNLITENLLEKIFISLETDTNTNKTFFLNLDHKQLFFTEGLQAALKLANPNAYKILFTKSLEYYQQTKNNLVLENLLTVIKSDKHFKSLENEILKLIINSNSKLGIELIANHFNLNNSNNSSINSLFLENLKLTNKSEDKNLLKSLCDFYEEFKGIIKIDADVKNELVLKVFAYIKPEDEIISNELINEFSTHAHQNYSSLLSLKDKNTLADWINFTKNKDDYNNYIGLCLKLDIIDDQLLGDILKNYDLISDDNKEEILKLINPTSINKQKYLKIFLNSLNINHKEDTVFLNRLISKCLPNINDCDPDFINLLYNKCYEFKGFIYDHSLNSLTSNLLQHINIYKQSIFSRHIHNFLEYIKITVLPNWRDIFNNDEYIFNYIDACYQHNIFNVSILKILIPMFTKKYFHQNTPYYAKKLNCLIYMADKNNLRNTKSLINDNMHTILNPYEEPKLKIFVALLFKNNKYLEIFNYSKGFLIDPDNISNLFFNNKKAEIINVEEYFYNINAITNLESVINPEIEKELFDKLLFIKNMNINLEKSLHDYSKKQPFEYTQKRLQQIFEFFTQALFNKKLTTERLIQLLKDPENIFFFEDENNDFINAFNALRIHNNTGRTSSLNPKETATWKMLKTAAILNENLSLTRKASNASNSTTDSFSEKDSIRNTELN